MDVFSKSMASAASGMQTQGFRMRVVSENISNAETPGFQRKTLSFGSVYDRTTGANIVSVDRVGLDDSALEVVHNPAHPLADENGNVEMTNVNLMTEMADGREAARTYEANLQTFQQAREMYQGLLELLRR